MITIVIIILILTGFLKDFPLFHKIYQIAFEARKSVCERESERERERKSERVRWRKKNLTIIIIISIIIIIIFIIFVTIFIIFIIVINELLFFLSLLLLFSTGHGPQSNYQSPNKLILRKKK